MGRDFAYTPNDLTLKHSRLQRSDNYFFSECSMVITHASEPYFEVCGVRFVLFICTLPLGSFMTCVLLSMILHWDQVTHTHCNVPNYVPSISAATGDFSPEKYIWRIGIAYHSLFRMIMPFVYYNFYKSKANSQHKWFPWLNSLNSFTHVIENFSLVVLTYISSSDHFSIHEASFITFQVSSMVYMLLSCFLYRSTISVPPSYEESVSLRWKIIFLMINYTSFLTAVYFFFRHNWYCEPGVYSLFAFCEYLTVISNIAFHGTAALDIKGAMLTFGHTIKTVAKNH